MQARQSYSSRTISPGFLPQEPVNWWAGSCDERREPASAWREDLRLRRFRQYLGSSCRGGPFTIGRFVHLRWTLSDPEWPWTGPGWSSR